MLLQEKHVETAKQLLGDGRALNRFVARILDDIGNLKAMLQAIAIGAQPCTSLLMQLEIYTGEGNTGPFLQLPNMPNRVDASSGCGWAS